MNKFFESLREHAKSIIDFEKRKMLPLTRKELESHEEAKVCYICLIRFFKRLIKLNVKVVVAFLNINVSRVV